jgi:hypothetical protein
MKKVKSLAKHPAIIIPVIMAVLYFGWKGVVAAGLEQLVHNVLLGIMAVACAVLLVTWAFRGLKEARSLWKKKQIGSAVVAAILPVISIVTLGTAVVIPFVCGVEMIGLSAELIICVVATVLFFGVIVEVLPFLLRP